MVDEKKIMHIAKLARLKIDIKDAPHYGEQLTKVLNHFDQISKIDTTNIEPMTSPIDGDYFTDLSFREDTVQSLFTAEEMLENAPEKMGNLFKVPPVVG